MKNVKKFEDFVRENTENKGKGVGGDTDFFSDLRPSPKQTVNKEDLDPLANLGIRGRQITTDKIDGIVKNVTGGDVFIEDRLTKEIKKYSLPDFLKEFHKSYTKEKKEEIKKESISIEEIEQPSLEKQDKELLNKILNLNENSGEKEIWEKKWENFIENQVKATSIEPLLNESKELDDKNETNPIEKSKIKVEKFSEFFKNKINIKPDSIEEDINNTDDFIDENLVPKQKPQVKCNECDMLVIDDDLEKIGHLYSKHNFKPTVDDTNKWFLEYFPPAIKKEKEMK